MRAQFSQRFCRRCDYCQPCSQGISIQFALGLKFLIKRFGSVTEELSWVNEGLAKARTCTQCGECLPRCPYQLPIPQLIRENLEWYDSHKRG
jgi:predicted aldo/keto reductase-like oxidoreductase